MNGCGRFIVMAVRAANSWYNPDEDECPAEKLLSDFSL